MKKGLKRLTREMLMAWEPCYDDEGIDDIAGKRRRSMSVTQVSALQIDAEDRLWVLAHWIAEFGARPARLFACDCAEALCRVEDLCEVIRTARRFANRHATRREMSAIMYSAPIAWSSRAVLCVIDLDHRYAAWGTALEVHKITDGESDLLQYAVTCLNALIAGRDPWKKARGSRRNKAAIGRKKAA